MLDFISLIFTVLGFVGYYADIYPLLIASFIYYIIEMLIGIGTEQQKSLNTTIIAVIIGIVLSKINGWNVFKTIMIALNYESALITLFGIVYFIIFMFSYKKHDN